MPALPPPTAVVARPWAPPVRLLSWGFLLLLLAPVWSASAAPVTFNREVAPLIFRHCAACHRPGEEGPFPLLTYAQAKKKGPTIVEVTARRFMPPWQPAPGHFKFLGDRRLADSDIAVFRRWVEDGMLEGDAKDLPPVPDFGGVWQLGEPDLIVTPAVPFPLRAEGSDLYRNLVITLPGATSNRYVRAIQFRPENRAVHHAFMLVDRTGKTRAEDAKDSEPGFPGLDLPDGMESPGGHFLSWQPGRRSYESPPGLAWTLPAGADLVVQLHLQPSGRPELIAPRIGVYVTHRPPEREFFKLDLASLTLDIPPGVSNHVVEDAFTLPADVTLIGVNPHCHYLGRDLRGLAVLPNGVTNLLLHIPEWNFNWQGDYRFAEPVSLPAGTRLLMRYVFDNTTNNPFNPNHPPVRVRYGVQTQDEMAELWLQMLPNTPQGLAKLRNAYGMKAIPDIVAYQQYRLRLNPDDAHARSRLGTALAQLGNVAGGMEQLRKSIQLNPADAYAHFNLGILHQQRKDAVAAEREFAEAVRLNPDHAQAHGSLGIALGERGRLAEAEHHLREAVRLDPNDQLARNTLAEVVRLRATVRRKK